MLYRAYGLTLSSSHPLPELARVRRGRAALRLVFTRRRLGTRGWRDAAPRLHDDGTPWLVVSRRDGAFRIRFGSQGDFVWRPDDRVLTVYRRTFTSAATMRHLAIDQALPLVLGHESTTVLHASACETMAGAVAFLGATGAGKSTIAAAFGANGCPVIADDAVVLRRNGKDLAAVPSYAGARLWPDVLSVGSSTRRPSRRSSSAKRRLSGAETTIAFARRPSRLARIYLLASAASGPREVRIEPLTGRDSLIELLRHGYVLDVRDRGRLQEQLERLIRDCVPVGVRRLAYPRDLRWLDRVRDAVLADVSRR